MKRFISMLIVSLLAVGMISGCSSDQSENPVTETESQVAIRVGDQQVSENEYYRYMVSTRSSLLGSEEDTAAFWATETEDGVTYSDAAVEAVEEKWIRVKLFAEEFDRLGLSFSESDEEDFNATLEQEITSAGGMTAFRERLLASHYTYEEYKTALYDTMKKERVLTYYFGSGGSQEVSAEELKQFYSENYARIKMIMISKVDSYYGEPLEESELESNREKMEDAYASAQRKIDPSYFDELISLYSSDKSTRGTGAIYHKSSEDDMAKMAFEMKVGEVITYENDVAFYVIQRFDATTEDVFTEEVQFSLIEEFCAEQINALIRQWRADTEIEIDSEVTALYRPENLISQ